MTWSNFKQEKEAREMYEKYKGEKASRMLYQYKVVEKDGDEEMTEKMRKFAERNYTDKYVDKIDNDHETKLRSSFKVFVQQTVEIDNSVILEDAHDDLLNMDEEETDEVVDVVF